MAMINLGLTRITRLLVLSPTRQTWKAIHIAGTNGKGSVAAYLSSLLKRLGRVVESSNQDGKHSLKIGKFTSPHLIDRWDCIMIDDKPVEKSVFDRVEAEVKRRASEVERNILEASKPDQGADNDGTRETTDIQNDAKVTPFELLTATAFEIFSQQKCNVAIIECGLGGRLDATNALKAEDVIASVITKIGLDHQGFLGNTVEEIARQKAGIAKPGVLMVLDETNGEHVKQAVKGEALKRGADSVMESNSEIWTFLNLGAGLKNLELPPHQIQNLGLALTVLEQLGKSGKLMRDERIELARPEDRVVESVLEDVAESYPGRLQRLKKGWATGVDGLELFQTPALLDGAHNTQSAQVLREYVDKHTMTDKRTKGIFWIMAMSRGKNDTEILQILVRPEDRVIFCEFGPVEGMPWVKPMATKDLTEATARVGGAEKFRRESSDIYHALQALATMAGESRENNGVQGSGQRESMSLDEYPVVIAGSLYLVSDLHRLLRDGRVAFEKHMSLPS